MKRNLRILGLTSAIALSFGAAHGATATDSFGVSATVEDSCLVSSVAHAFGSFAAIDNLNVDSSSAVSVTCSNGTAYNIGLDAGANGASATDRQMASGLDRLNYALYSDSARTVNWGNTVGTDTVADTGSGSSVDHTVYGQIPAGQQTAPVGAYADTIAVTVTY